MTFRKYRKVNPGQSWDTISREVAGQLEANDTLEMKYIRAKGTKKMYVAYARERCEEPNVGDFKFIDGGAKKDLQIIIEANVYNPNKLPREIKVIQPNWARKSLFCVFIKQ